MKRFCAYLLLVLGLSPFAQATIRYVAQGNPTPAAPYTNWSTAATTIQEAVDVCIIGDTVLVSNGVYASGTRPTPGFAVSNRVVLTNNISLRSVNGPAVTVIQGGGTTGVTAVRCVYLTSNAQLIGFTLRGGYTRAIGGSVTNDSSGGGLFLTGSGLASNCEIRNCSASYGGGVWMYAGGELTDSLIVSNRSSNYGGGLRVELGHNSFINRCVFRDNFSDSGAAAYLRMGTRMVNCLIVSNLATTFAGAIYADTGTNVILSGCTIADNVAGITNAGIHFFTTGPRLLNCILVRNTNGNWSGGSYSNCISSPLPPGAGNLNVDPLFVGSAYRLAASSPARDAGNNGFVISATDLDRNPRISGANVDIGCYELSTDTNLIATVPAIPLGPATGLAWQALGYVAYGATVTNGGAEYRFDWGDGTLSGWNTGGTVHVWSVPGLYAVRAQARAALNPAGESSWSDPLSVTITLEAGGSATRYVALGGGNVPPFTSWLTAATTLQAAVDYALPGDLVLVSNGVYQAGQRALAGEAVTNRLVLTSDVVVRSVNGPLVTFISGNNLGDTNRVRGVYMTGGRLEGFSITNGFTPTSGVTQADYSGGGVFAPGGTLANCVVRGNRSGVGGGVYGGRLVNCILSQNLANDGGGAAACSLVHCTVSSNAANVTAGGVEASSATNCIVYFNTCSSPGAPNYLDVDFAYSCSTPPPAGPGNIATDPQLLNPVTDQRVRGSSPCIDAALALDDVTNDFLYSPRPIDGNGDAFALPDMGAYEMVSVHYVAPGGAHVPPFATWANAATTIQAAADVALAGDSVLVSNGTYATGTRLTPGSGVLVSRVVISNSLSVRSINGAGATIIQGAGSPGATNGVRAVFMTNGASLSGFTLAGGFTRFAASNAVDIAGGGVLGGGGSSPASYVSNCVITGCGAVNGGGAAQVTLVNCDLIGNVATNFGGGLYQASLDRGRLVGNTAYGSGGGAYLGQLTNVLVVSNAAYNGGGVFGGSLTFCTVANNQAWLQGGVASVTGLSCIVYHNTAFSNANHGASVLRWTCTTPLPSNGFACISTTPGFLGLGDYRLRADSPCIDAGTNNVTSRDLTSAPRPVDGNYDALAIADMGALEYDPATQDSDGDGFADAVEHAAGSDPVNALSQPSGIAGQILYPGPQTGTVFLLVNGGTNQALAGPGPYALTNVANLVAYTLAAFRDANGNGAFDPWEPAGAYPANPLVFTQSVGNADITLMENLIVDTDGDGLPDYAEVYMHGTDPYVADTDQDGVHDGDELLHGANPNDPASTLVSATGTVVYAGAQTGTVYLLVDAATNGNIAGPGPFVLSNLVTQTDHVFAAYLDASGNGAFDPWEPAGVYTGGPVVVTGSIDGIEIVLTENALVDTDGDGLSDFAEVYTHGTNPSDADTDHDGTPDGVEVAYALAPLDPAVFFVTATGAVSYAGAQTGMVYLLVDGVTNRTFAQPAAFAVSNLLSTTSHVFFAFVDASGNGMVDPWEPQAAHPDQPFVFTQPVVNVSWAMAENRAVDSDHDGLADYDEVYVHHTDPYVVTTNVDSDLDGLSDYAEIFTFLTDPHEADTDHDGLTDGFEVLTYHTDPLDADTDGDGFSDGEEFQRGTNPRGFKSPSHLADFDGDGRADLAVFHAQQGDWHIVASLTGTPGKTPWGSKSSIPVPADYNGDGRADIAYYLPDSGDWYVRGSTGVVVRMTNSAPVPVPADYDGDGLDDFALYKKSTGDWTIRKSASGQTIVRNWGWADAMPVPADYDGDGRDDLAVYHPASGNWHLLESRSNSIRVINWGWPAAQPVPGDYDGDGKADLAVFHRATGQWFVRGPAGQMVKFRLGSSAVAPVPADYDGDGRTDAAVYQPADGAWLIRWSSPHIQTTINWGWRDARPVLRQYQINRAYGFIP